MLYCWAILPLAGVKSARIMVGEGLPLAVVADGGDRLIGGVILGLDTFFVGIEPTLGGDEVDDRLHDIAVALFFRVLQHAGLRGGAEAGALTGDIAGRA